MLQTAIGWLTICLFRINQADANAAWEVGMLAVSQQQPLPSEFSVNDRIPFRLVQSFTSLPTWCSNNQEFSALQRGICSMAPVVATAAVNGYKMALKFCSSEFADEKWNCSLSRNMWETNLTNHTRSTLFDDDVLPRGLRDTREAAFYYAITRAGIAHSITDACTKQYAEGCWMEADGVPQDNLLRALRKSKNLIIPMISKVLSRASIVKLAISEDWRWGNESHNIEHGIKHSRRQLEYGKHNARLSISDRLNLHNTNVGRKVYEKAVLLVCKCHGMSGSCATRTCWRRQADFRKVSRELKNIYFAARRVHKLESDDPTAGKSLYYGSKRRRKLNKGQLGFSRKTPNLCQRNQRLGVLGTRDRTCANLSESACQRLCCGRGYNSRLVPVENKCGCEFSWCCHVKCSTCQQLSVLRTCRE